MMKFQKWLWIAVLMFVTSQANAAVCTSLSAGNWNVVARWSCGHVPVAADTVVIANNVTLNANYTIAGLTINNGVTLNNSGTRTLTITGNLQVNGTVNASAAGAIRFGITGAASVISGSGTFNNAYLYTSGAAVSVAAGSALNFTGASQIFTGRTSGGANALTSVLTINGTINSTVPVATTFFNLYANSTVVSSTGAINASASRLIYRNATAAFTNNGSVNFNYLTRNAAGNVWTQGANSSLTTSAPSTLGTFNASASGNTVIYNGTSTVLAPTAAGYFNVAGSIFPAACPIIYTVSGSNPCPVIVTQTRSPTACVNEGAGVSWQNSVAPAATLTGPYAVGGANSFAGLTTANPTTKYLKCTNYGFTIPVGATILGIRVDLRRLSSANNTIRDNSVRLVRNVSGTAVTQASPDRATATMYTTAYVVEAHGGAADLWSPLVWLPADINSVNFGAAISSIRTSGGAATRTVRVDHMPISVSYSMPSGPHHIRILHDGNGLTCTPSVLTVIACANATCTAPHYTASVVAGNVTWAGAPGGTIPFTITTGGTTTVNLPVTTVQTVTLGTSAVTPTPQAASDCVNGAGGAACSQPFADSGILLNVPNHVAEVSQTLSISAVRKANNALNCVPAFSGVSRTVNLRCAYLNPNSGTLPVRVAGTALNAAANAAAACDGAGRNLTLAFNVSGTASATLQYADVGQMTLNASYNGSAATSDTGLVMTGTTSFIAAPASFAFSAVTAGLIKAGDPFSATVTARNNAGNATPNFGRETAAEGVTLSSNLVAPVGGANPAVGNNVIAGSAFSNGAATVNNLSWGEVGLITLTANLTSGNYLSSGVTAATGVSGNIGRFIPHHLDTVISGAMPCPTGLACPVTFNGFVYSGQPFTIQVNALNRTGAYTRNYDGVLNYSKVVTLSAWDALGSTTTQNPGPGSLSNNSIAIADFISGSALINAGNVAPATLAPVYTFSGAMTVPTEIYLRAIDTDGASSLRTPATSSVEGGILVVNGRIRVVNAYGSERLPLIMPVNVQYWNGSNWTLSTTDNSTAFDTRLSPVGNVVPVIIQGPLALANVSVMGGGAVTVAGGASGFTLAAPNVSGMVDLNINAPAYLVPLPGRATFGVYGAANPFIYQREAY